MRLTLLLFALLSVAFLANAEEKEAPKAKPGKEAEKKPDKKEEKKSEEKKGKKAPDFELLDLDGKKRTLKEFKGKPVVLEWCNYNCPYVKKHYKNGDLQALQKEYAKKGVVWLAIMSTNPKHKDYRDAKALKGMNSERKSNHTAMLMDADGKVGRAYKARVTPHFFVVDKDGYIAYEGAIDSVRSADPADIKGATNYVKVALDALLANKKVETAATKPYG